MNPFSAVVYTAQASDVAYTVVDGEVVVSAGRLVNLCERTLRQEATREADRLYRRAGIA